MPGSGNTEKQEDTVFISNKLLVLVGKLVSTNNYNSMWFTTMYSIIQVGIKYME